MVRPKPDQLDPLLRVKFVSNHEYYNKLAFNMNWKLDAQKYVPSLLTYTVTRKYCDLFKTKQLTLEIHVRSSQELSNHKYFPQSTLYTA